MRPTEVRRRGQGAGGGYLEKKGGTREVRKRGGKGPGGDYLEEDGRIKKS